MSTLDKIVKVDVDLSNDFQKTKELEAIFYSQDKNTAVFEFYVTDGTEAVDLNTSGFIPSLAIRTFDNALFTSDDFTIEGNKVTFVLPEEYLKRIGRAYGEFFITQGDKKISAVMFKFKIKLSITDFPAPANEAFLITLRTLIEEYAGNKQNSVSDEMTYEKAIELGLNPEYYSKQDYDEIAQQHRDALNTNFENAAKYGYQSYTKEEFIYSMLQDVETRLLNASKYNDLIGYGTLSDYSKPQDYINYQNAIFAEKGVYNGNFIEYLYDKSEKQKRLIDELTARIEALENVQGGI